METHRSFRIFGSAVFNMDVRSIHCTVNPQMPTVKIHLRTPKGGGVDTTPLDFCLPFLKIFLMGMFSESRNPTVLMKKFYLHCMTLKIKVKHFFA